MAAIRRDPKGRLDHLHRAGAIVFGLGLAGFGVIGMLSQLELFSTTGRVLLGLSTNGALAVLSVVVGAVLVVAGVLGGRVASTALVVAGAAFVLSGVVNVLVLNTALNLLAFGMSNVIFSLVAGLLLLILGSWGRYAGHLPHDNPYWQERHAHDAPPAELPTHFDDPADARAAAELAEADRAVAQHTASPSWSPGSRRCVACAERRTGFAPGADSTPDSDDHSDYAEHDPPSMPHRHRHPATRRNPGVGISG